MWRSMTPEEPTRLMSWILNWERMLIWEMEPNWRPAAVLMKTTGTRQKQKEDGFKMLQVVMEHWVLHPPSLILLCRPPPPLPSLGVSPPSIQFTWTKKRKCWVAAPSLSMDSSFSWGGKIEWKKNQNFKSPILKWFSHWTLQNIYQRERNNFAILDIQLTWWQMYLMCHINCIDFF